jgi:hypothetical protein
MHINQYNLIPHKKMKIKESISGFFSLTEYITETIVPSKSNERISTKITKGNDAVTITRYYFSSY